MQFESAPGTRDAAVGERRLSVAVGEGGVTLVVVANGRPHACTISLDDWDLLVHHVEIGRPAELRATEDDSADL